MRLVCCDRGDVAVSDSLRVLVFLQSWRAVSSSCAWFSSSYTHMGFLLHTFPFQWHELFLKGRPGLCVNMKRTKVGIYL